jgi:predicted dinucleotide-binding enzyme
MFALSKTGDMRTKQTIAIIGLGEMGKALATGLAKGHDRVLLVGHDEKAAAEFVQTLLQVNPAYDVEAITCAADASWEADIIIPAIPHEALVEVVTYIKEYANQKIVISIVNPVHEGGKEICVVEELQKLLPNSKIVKAFTTTKPESFYETSSDCKKIDCPISGSDAEAVENVIALVDIIGFNPLVSGELKQQPKEATHSEILSIA